MNARIEKKKYKKLYEQATRLLNQRIAADYLRQRAFTPEIKTIKYKKLVTYREIAARSGTEIEMDLATAICDFLVTQDCIKYTVERSDIMDGQEFTAWLHVAIYPDEC